MILIFQFSGGREKNISNAMTKLLLSSFIFLSGIELRSFEYGSQNTTKFFFSSTISLLQIVTQRFCSVFNFTVKGLPPWTNSDELLYFNDLFPHICLNTPKQLMTIIFTLYPPTYILYPKIICPITNGII